MFQVDETLDIKCLQSSCGSMDYSLAQWPSPEVGFEKVSF